MIRKKKRDNNVFAKRLDSLMKSIASQMT